MNRREKLLCNIDVARCSGVEIGALCRPLITRKDGQVFYVDHADTATLRQKYRTDPDVDVDALVDVDAVWGDRPLAEALEARVDYIVASHVVEHVPDLISWLGELASILRPGGEIRLAIPDRRFTFDYLRSETRLSDVVYAHMMRARTPLPHIVLDYVMNVVKMDGSAAWNGSLRPETLERHHSLAHAIACAAQAKDGVYHDVHCWVFTPTTFADLMIDLARNGLAIFECTRFFDTASMTIEFFVGLKPTVDRDAAVQSWKAMSRACVG